MDHKKDDTAIDIANGTVTTSSGNVKPKITTQGWQLLMLWKDKSTSWVKLKDLKVSNPVELAEYAVANRIVEEPAFKWWVSNTLHKWNHIISKVKKNDWRMMQKFGCKLPHSVEEALEIDRQTGTDHRQRALNKEMSNVKVAWNACDDITPDDVGSGKVKGMIGFQEIGCHIVFDIKMDFTRKARFCAGGHTTDTPAAMMYSSVVLRDSVQIGFMLAALNGMDMMACDLENVYLNAPCVEKIWIEGGLECGSDKGKVCVVVRAVYSLKSAGASWRAMLAQALHDIGFVSTIADPNVWIQPAAHKEGHGDYEMLLVYVDDVLAISHEPKVLIDAIGEYYKVKPRSHKEPDIYLGANVKKVQMPDDREVWATSPHDYIKNAIKTVKGLLAEDREGYVLKNKAKNPFPMNYQPKLDVSNELGGIVFSLFTAYRYCVMGN
jgi:hypothetical protein